MSKKIFLASDHAGFETKEYIKEQLTEEGFQVVDCGARQYDEADDYPDFIIPAAKEVAQDTATRGIIFGGSGQGEAIAANRIKGVRAAVYYGGVSDIPMLSREHNDANILSLGVRFLTKEEAWATAKLWLETAFSGDERHVRRIKKIDA